MIALVFLCGGLFVLSVWGLVAAVLERRTNAPKHCFLVAQIDDSGVVFTSEKAAQALIVKLKKMWPEEEFFLSHQPLNPPTTLSMEVLERRWFKRVEAI